MSTQIKKCRLKSFKGITLLTFCSSLNHGDRHFLKKYLRVNAELLIWTLNGNMYNYLLMIIHNILLSDRMWLNAYFSFDFELMYQILFFIFIIFHFNLLIRLEEMLTILVEQHHQLPKQWGNISTKTAPVLNWRNRKLFQDN